MTEMNIELARHNMIEQQVRPWDVLDQRVLDIMQSIPREEFVPDQYRHLAFIDTEIPLGHNQSMLPPRMEGRILQALNIQPDDKILEIGTGSGYMTALMASLGRQVYSVEIVPTFIESAAERLAEHDIHNVTLEIGDAASGWKAHIPYDVIAVTGSLPLLSDELKQNLAVGGRMFVVVGDAPNMEAQLITRVGEDDWQTEILFETEIAPLTNAPREQRFEL